MLDVHKKAGPLRVDSLALGIKAGPQGVTGTVGVTGGASIGPVTASVADVGAEGGAGNFTIAVWSLDLKVRTYVRCNGRNFKSFARGLSRNPIRSR